MSTEVKFLTPRVSVTIESRIENAPPTPCEWEAGNRQFIPQRVVAEFGHLTTVRVSGPRIVESCACDCHGRPALDDDYVPEYSITYYPGNESKKPPKWIGEWLRQVSPTAHKAGVSS